MQMQGNTIFITGGTSGIGRGLAEAFHELGNHVIVSGRREERLKEVCDTHPGMRSFALDVTDLEAVAAAARRVVAEFPGLNCVFNNAGIQRRFDFASPNPLDDGALVEEVTTNLLAPIRVAAAFLPHLTGQPNATLVNVSSGLAFVPMARAPVYCATKAAIHSWTLSLRRQLRNSGVRVLELIPPWVATELGGPGKPAGPGAMPLDAFVAETMKALASDADELAIGNSRNLADAACAAQVRQAFAGMNP